MLIATYNCNSIRSRLNIVLRWLNRCKPDVLALQETKCEDEHFPADDFYDNGWQVAFRGEKSYNGVAVVTKRRPDEVSFGLGADDGVSESRFLHVRLGDVHVLNSYVPQGVDVQSERFAGKLQWLRRVRQYLDGHFDPSASKVAWVGDLNVAPEPRDVYDSSRFQNHVCHCPTVVEAFREVTSWGLVDVFRKHHPEGGLYSFWDYRLPRMLEQNLGWRLDHILATAPLAERCTECFIDLAPRQERFPSDHTVVVAKFEI